MPILGRLTARTTLLTAAALLLVIAACSNEATTAPTEPGAITARTECPTNTDPDAPGPADQARPRLEMTSGVAVDTDTGVIVAVEIVPGSSAESSTRTWIFDLCNNTWREPTPATEPTLQPRTRLVYDPATRLTVAFGPENGSLWTYSTTANTWTEVAAELSHPAETELWNLTDLAYDPASESILLRDSDRLELWAYRPGSNTWTALEQGEVVPTEAGWQEAADGSRAHYHSLLAFDEERGDLVLVLLGDAMTRGQTWTYDPREGIWTRGAAGPPPLNTGYVEAGTEVAYDVAAGRTVVFSDGYLGIYDATADEWQGYTSLPGWPTPGDTGPLARMGHALVYDPFNERVLLLGGSYRGEDDFHAGDDVWALDIETMEWLELLASRP
jgi:hypothetical protein